jgi:hypothetical protein
MSENDWVHLPDIHECGERRAEAYVLPDGRVRCAGCEAACDAMDIVTVSENPYSAPLCPSCAEEAFPGR